MTEEIARLEEAAETIKEIEEKYNLKYYSSLNIFRLESIKKIIELCNKHNISSQIISFDACVNLKLKDIRTCSFLISHKPYITNSQTHYNFDNSEDDYIRLDNGNIGCLMFVSSTEYYEDVADIWKEFKDILLSYNPVDWDELNFDYVYTVEDGLRLYEDFANIYDTINKKMINRLKVKEIEELEARLNVLKEGSVKVDL